MKIINGLGIVTVFYLLILLRISQSKKLKALCLHGYLSCGKFMKVQLNHLLKETDHIVDYCFPDAPHTLSFKKDATITSLKSVDKCRWWYGAAEATGEEDEYRYDGIDVSLRFLMQLEKDKGPFDIVLGHSQGACLALTLDALITKPDLIQLILGNNNDDDNNKLPNTMTTILMSGFIPRDRLFNNIFQNIELKSNSLHLFSPEDDVVPPEASVEAMGLYRFPTMKMTVGGHDPTRDENDIDFIAKYITNCYKNKYERVDLED